MYFSLVAYKISPFCFLTVRIMMCLCGFLFIVIESFCVSEFLWSVGWLFLSVLKNANSYFPPFFFCLFTIISIDLSSLPIPSLAVFSLLISLSKYSSSLRPFFISNLFPLALCYSIHVLAKPTIYSYCPRTQLDSLTYLSIFFWRVPNW